MMITNEPSPHDETAVQTLLTAAANGDPQYLARPPALALIGARANRLRRVRRAQQAAGAVAAIMIVGVTLAVLPHGRPATGPATVSARGTMVMMSSSMEPTLRVGDSLVIDTTARTVQHLRRGDIIVFKDPGGWLPQPVPGHSASWLVKRVIGLPGDRLTCCDSAGRLTLNGAPLAEPYVAPGDRPSQVSFSVTVQQGRLWVMGDHRSISADSRTHRDTGNGQIPLDQVVGRVTAVTSAGSTSTVNAPSTP